MATTAKSEDAVRSVQRAFLVLSSFGPECPRATLTQVAQQCGLPTTTVSRLLATLEQLGFVRRHGDGSYALGIRMLQLGYAARQSFDLIDVAQPVLEELNQATGENTNLAIRADDRHFTYVAQLMSRHPIRHATWLGRTQPLSGTANGAALLGKTGTAGYIATRKTIEPDISAVAAPVCGPGGEIVAAVSVTGPTYRIDDEKLERFTRLVMQAAGRISRTLGGTFQTSLEVKTRRA